MNRFAKRKIDRIYTLFGTLSLKKFNILVECANTEAATELKE